MENYRSTLFEDDRHEKSIIKLLTLIDWRYFETCYIFGSWNKYNIRSCFTKTSKTKIIEGKCCFTIIRTAFSV